MLPPLIRGGLGWGLNNYAVVYVGKKFKEN